jgi:hypothetical protein
MDEALILWLAWRRRANLPVPRWVVPVVAVGGLASLGVKVTYDDQVRRFRNEIRAGWQAHERVLEEDPRNGQTLWLAWLQHAGPCLPAGYLPVLNQARPASMSSTARARVRR